MAGFVSSFLVLLLILQDSCYCFRSPLSVFKRFQESSSQSNGCSGSTRPVFSEDSSDYTLDIRMPGVTPTESDTYLCKSYRLPEDDESYVVDFKPHASMDTAHHMLLFGCGSPSSTEEYWDCGAGTCTDKSSIMYAWARNAPPTKLPKGVGFKVGGNSGIKYFVLQVHYGDVKAFQDKHKDCTGVTVQITPERQPLIAGIYLLMSMDTIIPAGEKTVYSDIACAYEKPTMYPFAYRVHTHQLGQVVSGYRIRNGKWTLIGRQSPQLPQAFYAVEHPLDVHAGDVLAARCVFTGEGRTSNTYIGGTSSDEMCNMYIMYYMEAAHSSSYMTCVRTGDPALFRHIPEIANIPVPVSSDMVMAHGSHKHMKEHEERNIQQQPKREEEQVMDQDVHLEEVTDWPGLNLKLGQVSGLALDPNDNLVIFHRGNHVWDENSFDRNFVYQARGIGAIEESTILTVSPNSSTILRSTGKNLFYLPHGITVDTDGNFWVTDVALHQVFKLGADGSRIFTLGKAFQPGSDRTHFCQPTDVAVDPITGNFFVSDGYCNSRIMQFSPQGMYIMQWGEASSSRFAKSGEFRIPHSLALIPDQGQLCVADRENGRIQCFHSETGKFVKEIKHAAFGSRVFAVAYASGGTLYAVNGKSFYGDSEPVQGFVMNFTTGDILDTFVPVKKNFDMPHDLVASDDGAVYVGDAHANTVWKFSSSEKAEHRSVKKAGIAIEEITETEILETRVRSRPKTNITAPEKHQEQAKQTQVQQGSVGVSFVLIITLLVIPVVVLVAIALFIRWRKNRVYGGEEHKSESSSGGILGKLRGKGAGGLNLGTFFASHKGYSRKGFDRLSTEGSDQEKDDDDGSDSEEEYSAPPIPAAAPAASSSS
ncbi:peptidyl-glycine alpha-amidating monooxygenase isoform X3 [Rana temporaria]|uniref:peptidyl-glycine alpha-amidating monooxygenase isoform X3 n=1 Tax=Rana temporaria TaxID=8407 RepID=UPI001AAE1491|nr:peptidyl-glycine alpha-amidating monooxygenase isoform X3 [Rana temporaria]